MDKLLHISCVAPVNIAVIKYWGKRNEELLLPLNDSISVTLDTTLMRTETTVVSSPTFEEDAIVLNGLIQPLKNVRLQNCLSEIRSRLERDPAKKAMSAWKVKIESRNTFPTGAGLASSASGYACLVCALCKLFELDISMAEMASIARKGSGSACRSLHGGFVRWHAGVSPGGEDSVAEQIAPGMHWPELRIFVAVVNMCEKEVGSTDGMQQTVQTSSLLQHRVKSVVPKRCEEMTQAILKKDFEAFALLTMKDSNQFHAVCLDTFPPLFYLNETSKSIIQFVHDYNAKHSAIKVAYTFDAGPNAVLLMEEDSLAEFAVAFYQRYSQKKPVSSFFINYALETTGESVENAHKVEYVVISKIGGGPKVLIPE
uniref:Diphosphomevalonate decarboxylase n=1 Tax=Lynceus sp. MCZ IZ 141354 TaxID=1930659 RepID=A0A9N6WRF2_9CRUS|nr:EOG090X0AX4 [Lynceus sp. MCZ IZ 141354]